MCTQESLIFTFRLQRKSILASWWDLEAKVINVRPQVYKHSLSGSIAMKYAHLLPPDYYLCAHFVYINFGYSTPWQKTFKLSLIY